MTDVLEEARLAFAQRQLQFIVTEMKTLRTLTRQYQGPFQSVLVALLEKEGFVVDTRVIGDETWVNVSVSISIIVNEMEALRTRFRVKTD